MLAPGGLLDSQTTDLQAIRNVLDVEEDVKQELDATDNKSFYGDEVAGARSQSYDPNDGMLPAVVNSGYIYTHHIVYRHAH